MRYIHCNSHFFIFSSYISDEDKYYVTCAIGPWGDNYELSEVAYNLYLHIKLNRRSEANGGYCEIYPQLYLLGYGEPVRKSTIYCPVCSLLRCVM